VKSYHCPNCGRFLVATDAPPGHAVRVPPCRRCGEQRILDTAKSYPPKERIAKPRR
jgi:predicted RNA-binding Zn-ribbon protein involved in translation (DUF1610 family)